MLTIKLNNMKFHSYIGVYAEEKKIGQNIEIDLACQMQSDQSRYTDDLTDTVSYGAIYRIIEKTVADSKVDLVERLGQQIFDDIRAVYDAEIVAMSLNIRKLAVPVNGIFDSVEITLTDTGKRGVDQWSLI